MKKHWLGVLIPLLIAVVLLSAWFVGKEETHPHSLSVAQVPAFAGKPYVIVNNNVPEFTSSDLLSDAYEFYSELDALGRCGYAMACIGKELMPTEDRGSIGQVKPSGWQTVKYDIVDGKYLYNRCHLIGFQLTGENANERNLITGTRYLNVEGMLPFENMVADYIKETGNHVLYRVTPIFDADNLVARGVQIEAQSIEDNAEGICFNVYAYNNQPGISIDYRTGMSILLHEQTAPDNTFGQSTYILNVNSKKFHTESCEQGSSIKEENRKEYTGARDTLIKQGYLPAGCCNP